MTNGTKLSGTSVKKLVLHTHGKYFVKNEIGEDDHIGSDCVENKLATLLR